VDEKYLSANQAAQEDEAVIKSYSLFNIEAEEAARTSIKQPHHHS
jgi:hypothetical protein